LRPETAPKASLNQQLAALPKMDRIALQRLWERFFLKPPNRSLRREILVPIIAYRLQEMALGGLKGSIDKQLRALAEDCPRGCKLIEGLTLRHKAGTRYVREWQGKLHEVSVLPEGYEYNGHIYRSLSEIARNITGTRWSGPAFFGIKRRSKEMAA
jgi:hypothetical protein